MNGDISTEMFLLIMGILAGMMGALALAGIYPFLCMFFLGVVAGSVLTAAVGGLL